VRGIIKGNSPAIQNKGTWINMGTLAGNTKGNNAIQTAVDLNQKKRKVTGTHWANQWEKVCQFPQKLIWGGRATALEEKGNGHLSLGC